MYGTRQVTLPRVRGRLYLNFDLVEIEAPSKASSASYDATITPTPGTWAPTRPAEAEPGTRGAAAAANKTLRILPQPKIWPPSLKEMEENQVYLLTEP
jgi:hypothetical protein